MGDSKNITSFPEYLKGLKARPVRNGQNRVEARKNRLNNRDMLRDSKRTYSPMPPTPCKPTAPPTFTKPSTMKKQPQTQQKQPETAAKPGKTVEELMDRLQKWRAERDKKRTAEKANKKPVFKVSRHVVIPSVAAMDLPLPSGAHNHTFKAPANIKPIQFHSNTTMKDVSGKNNMAVKKSVTKTKINEEKVLQPKNTNINIQTTRRKLNYSNKEEQITVKPERRITRQLSAMKQKGDDKVNVTVKTQTKQTRQTKKTTKLQPKIEEEVNKVADVDEVVITNKENVGNPKKTTKFAKTPVQTPKRRKSRRNLHETPENNENNDVSPVKNRKSNENQIKTPKTRKGRKSAGRTPGIRLINKQSEDIEEIKEDTEEL